MEIIAFVDTETGGLTPDRALLSVGVVVVEIGDCGRGVWPCFAAESRYDARPEHVDEEAIAVNGWAPGWHGVTHGPPVEIGTRISIPWPPEHDPGLIYAFNARFDRQWIDGPVECLRQLAVRVWPELGWPDPARRSLDGYRSAARLGRRPLSHGALADAWAACELWCVMRNHALKQIEEFGSTRLTTRDLDLLAIRGD